MKSRTVTQMIESPQIGDYYLFCRFQGIYRIYTSRGWILCDSKEELEHELESTPPLD